MDQFQVGPASPAGTRPTGRPFKGQVQRGQRPFGGDQQDQFPGGFGQASVLLARPAEPSFQPPALADVLGDPQEAAQLATGVATGGQNDPGPETRAVLADA